MLFELLEGCPKLRFFFSAPVLLEALCTLHGLLRTRNACLEVLHGFAEAFHILSCMLQLRNQLLLVPGCLQRLSHSIQALQNRLPHLGLQGIQPFQGIRALGLQRGHLLAKREAHSAQRLVGIVHLLDQLCSLIQKLPSSRAEPFTSGLLRQIHALKRLSLQLGKRHPAELFEPLTRGLAGLNASDALRELVAGALAAGLYRPHALRQHLGLLLRAGQLACYDLPCLVLPSGYFADGRLELVYQITQLWLIQCVRGDV
mmetsp:Transcript_17707/g.41576  ORF Transcript_17707/g.41576 Transcript_17707/m.41576 type:complete len:258 (+) Transcript_17707:653-1426(+)